MSSECDISNPQSDTDIAAEMLGVDVLAPAPLTHFCSPANAPFYETRPYKTLDTTCKEIRLIKLHAGPLNDPLRCDLVQNVSLADSNYPYQTISYCAGDPNATSAITVNGLPFNAFLGVAHALRAVRRAHELLIEEGGTAPLPLLWVDQICINQSDLAERSHQVSSMRDIYRGAFRVLVWLGGDNDDPGEGLHLISRLVDMYRCLSCPKPDEGKSGANVANLVDIIAKVSLEPEHSERFNLGWRGIRDVLQSPWWTRCWIVQELLCSKRHIVHYGRYSIPWEEFRPGILLVTAIYDKISSTFDRSLGTTKEDNILSLMDRFDLKAARRLIELKENWGNDTDVDIKAVLDRLRDFKSSDPRDRIYAICGLVRPEYGIVPNYSDSNIMRDVLIETLHRILSIDRDLEFLLFVEAHRSQEMLLPSWVPQWTSRLEDKGYIQKGRTVGTVQVDAWRTRQYHASGTLTSNITVARYTAHPEYVLRVEGIILGPIAKAETLGEIEEYPTSLGAVIEIWKKTAACETGAKYFNGDDLDNVLFDMLSELLGKELVGETSLDALREVKQTQTQGDGRPSYGDLSSNLVAMSVWSSIGNRRFFRSPSGYIGLAPFNARPQHLLCILFGCSAPCVLLKIGSDYILVGIAYIHGLMNGEAICMMEEGLVTRESISII